MAGEDVNGPGVGSVSHVRDSEADLDDEHTRALGRVEEYLAALGLSQQGRAVALADEIVCAAELAGARSAAESVAAAQARVLAFERALFGERAAELQPLWWRSFIEVHPEAFLGEIGLAKQSVARFGDPFEGSAPRAVRFGEAMRVEPLLARWAICLSLPLTITAVAVLWLWHGIEVPRLDPLVIAFVSCFAILFALTALGFSTALLGFIAGFRTPRTARSGGPLPRTAVVIPIYNESAEHVFAGILAMRESLAHTGDADAFELVVLSDTRDVLCAADEERAYRRAAASSEASIPIYYRRRTRNDRQKAGNLAEFFERYGDRYEYAVVLDADSLMRGDTIVEMARRMEAAPNVALLQAPLALHRGSSLFSRAQQLVASVCGPLFMRGLSVWAGAQGNYYGHNAIVRVKAFVQCCALPELRGEPPFGGHILSHDFVEAALLCRAGYEVRIAADLTGSWEEMPQTLPDYIARDRRWCQGNMQHLRIAFSAGFRPMSRLHMWVGALSYMASPLWLAFVLMSLALALRSPHGFLSARLAWPLLLATACLLFLPRLFGFIETFRQVEKRRAHGGAIRLAASVWVETMLSMLLSPLMMLHHSRIVFSIISGQAVRWAAQQRRAQSAVQTVVRPEYLATVLGLVCAVGSTLAPSTLWLWLAPLWLPWLFAMPIALAASSEGTGTIARRFGLLWTPSEVAPDELCLRVDDFRAITAADGSARFRDIVLDPVLNRAHVAALGARASKGGKKPEPTRSAISLAGELAPKMLSPELLALCERAARGGPTALDAREQSRVLDDPECVLWLHREAWQKWPVETWGLSRLGPQLPPPREEHVVLS